MAPVKATTSVAATRTMAIGSLEGNHAFEHESPEASAVPDVCHGEADVPLVDVLSLGQHVGGHEPAAAGLPAVGAHVIGDAGQRAGRLVIADGDVGRFVR